VKGVFPLHYSGAMFRFSRWWVKGPSPEAENRRIAGLASEDQGKLKDVRLGTSVVAEMGVVEESIKSKWGGGMGR